MGRGGVRVEVLSLERPEVIRRRSWTVKWQKPYSVGLLKASWWHARPQSEGLGAGLTGEGEGESEATEVRGRCGGARPGCRLSEGGMRPT